jgi:hypothetical protein
MQRFAGDSIPSWILKVCDLSSIVNATRHRRSSVMMDVRQLGA